MVRPKSKAAYAGQEELVSYGMKGQARRCAAKRRGIDQRCKNRAVTGCNVCRIHGGKSKRGSESGAFKDGSMSNYVPKNLFAKWESARSDPELLSLQNDAALLSTRTAELLENLESNPPPWIEAEKMMQEVEKASTLTDKHDKLKELKRIILDGAAASSQYLASWRELREVAIEKSRLTVAELKRMKTLSEYMSGKDARALVASVLGAVKENVKDPSVLLKINASIQRALSMNTREPMDCTIPVPSETKPTPVVIDAEPEPGVVIPFEQGQ